MALTLSLFLSCAAAATSASRHALLIASIPTQSGRLRRLPMIGGGSREPMPIRTSSRVARCLSTYEGALFSYVGVESVEAGLHIAGPVGNVLTVGYFG